MGHGTELREHAGKVFVDWKEVQISVYILLAQAQSHDHSHEGGSEMPKEKG